MGDIGIPEPWLREPFDPGFSPEVDPRFETAYKHSQINPEFTNGMPPGSVMPSHWYDYGYKTSPIVLPWWGALTWCGVAFLLLLGLFIKMWFVDGMSFKV